MSVIFDRLTQLAALLLVASGCGGMPAEAQAGSEAQAVVGGAAASTEERFATVAVLDSEGFQYCSGVLIEPTVVLTAAHCVVLQDGDGHVTAGLGPKNLEVVAGALDVTQATAAQHFSVSKVLRHPGFPGAGGAGVLGARDDIALLVLERAVSELEPVALLPGAELERVLTPDAPLLVAGYGVSDQEHALDGTLFNAETPYAGRNDSELVAGAPGHADTCTGDSGGPAYAFMDNRPTLVGLASRSASADGGCGDGGIYTLVTAHATWIHRELVGAGLAADEAAHDRACSVVAPGSGAHAPFAVALGLALCVARRRRRRAAP